MAIHEWEYYAQCSRLRTKREKKRLQKTNRDKKLIQLDKELKQIQREQHNLGYKELTPPVQRGWKRSFVLIHDIRTASDKAFFETLLKKINDVQYSHRKDFKKTKKRKGKKVLVDRVQSLKELYEHHYSKLTDKEKLFFIEQQRDHYIGNGRIGQYKVYVFAEPWRFVLKTVANMITKIRLIEPLLLQEEAEIDNYFKNRNLYPKLWKLRDGSCYNNNRWNPTVKNKYKYLLKQTFIKNEIDEYYKDKQKNEQ